MKKVYVVIAFALVLGLIFTFRHTLVPSIGGAPEGERLAEIQTQSNYRDGSLQNDLALDESLSAVMGAIFGERAEATKPDKPLSFPPSEIPSEAADLAVTWLGHSSVLLEIEGQRIMIDPMWSDYASPVNGVGPERYLVSPLKKEDVPSVEAVIISHDHYDHLDMESIQYLSERGTQFVVPIGIGAHLEAWGVPAEQIHELGWWGEYTAGSLRIVCTPARHFSGREVVDRFATLWAGWAMIGAEQKLFFSGDSGMGPHFTEIGKRLGPFDLSMFEVGSYDPAWPDVHLGPEQALEAHRASNGKYMLPVHWSTFVMGNHSWTEPGERLLAAANPKDKLLLPKPGQRISLNPLDAELPQTRWWPDTPWRTAEEAPIVSHQ
jgi:L-ascorbate metabolism protein UlaG (beta-lactamase superfamily)